MGGPGDLVAVGLTFHARVRGMDAHARVIRRAQRDFRRANRAKIDRGRTVRRALESHLKSLGLKPRDWRLVAAPRRGMSELEMLADMGTASGMRHAVFEVYGLVDDRVLTIQATWLPEWWDRRIVDGISMRGSFSRLRTDHGFDGPSQTIGDAASLAAMVHSARMHALRDEYSTMSWGAMVGFMEESRNAVLESRSHN